jgi:aminopeptidase-like protein
MRGDNTARDSRAAATPGAVPGVAQSTGPLARRPRRAPDMRDLMTVVTTHNLSRGHRAILLLADGHHNILDIARLASKTVDEVTQLITDLQTRGLIYFYE